MAIPCTKKCEVSSLWQKSGATRVKGYPAPLLDAIVKEYNPLQLSAEFVHQI
jgi:hypothetical protein